MPSTAPALPEDRGGLETGNGISLGIGHSGLIPTFQADELITNLSRLPATVGLLRTKNTTLPPNSPLRRSIQSYDRLRTSRSFTPDHAVLRKDSKDAFLESENLYIVCGSDLDWTRYESRKVGVGVLTRIAKLEEVTKLMGKLSADLEKIALLPHRTISIQLSYITLISPRTRCITRTAQGLWS